MCICFKNKFNENDIVSSVTMVKENSFQANNLKSQTKCPKALQNRIF